MEKTRAEAEELRRKAALLSRESSAQSRRAVQAETTIRELQVGHVVWYGTCAPLRYSEPRGARLVIDCPPPMMIGLLYLFAFPVSACSMNANGCGSQSTSNCSRHRRMSMPRGSTPLAMRPPLPRSAPFAAASRLISSACVPRTRSPSQVCLPVSECCVAVANAGGGGGRVICCSNT